MKTSRVCRTLALAGALVLAGSATSRAQDGGVFFELRGGVNVPTFDIADAADAGPSFGVGIGVPLGSRLSLMGDADFGFHEGAADGPDLNVYHYIGKLGVELLNRDATRWSFIVNAGAGAMSFDIDAPEVDTETYFAINVGAKIGYDVSDRVSLFLSPQGDIAFSDEDVLGTDNAWVWPFSAGFKVKI